MKFGFSGAAALAAVLAVVPARPARAAPSGKPAKTPERQPAAAPPSPAAAEVSSPALRVSTPPANVAELMDHFRYIDKNLESLRAVFRQSVYMVDAGIQQSTEGTVRYAKPSRLRLEHSKPERQTIVSDGKTIWIYRQDQNQVIESALEDWKKADPIAGRLLDFGNYANLLRTYDVSFDSGTLDVALKPKDGSRDFSLRLRLGGPALFPVETDLTVGQMEIRTRFEDLAFNNPLPDALFAFTPPAGADVFRNFKPPVAGRKDP